MENFKKLAPVFFKATSMNVDVTSGILKDVVIINKGLDKNGDRIDDTFIKQIVEQGNAQAMGVKSRFGHPNMCDTTLGSFIGRYKNFRESSTGAIADLHLDETSKISPMGNLFDYVVNMSAKNDDMFGNSIAFVEDEPEMKDDVIDGKNVRVPFIRCKNFLASDLVDSPAATESLFKSKDIQKNFAAIATSFLDENPEVFELLDKDETILSAFLHKYKNHLNMSTTKNKSILQKLKEKLNVILQKSVDVTTDAGDTLTISDDDGDGKPGVGDLVSSADGSPVTPNTTITLINGDTIVVDGESKISSISAAAAAPANDEPPPDIELSLDEQIAKFKSDLSARDTTVADLEKKLSERDALIEQNEKDAADVETKVTELEEKLKKIQSVDEGVAGSQKFNSDKKKSNRNRVADAHAEREAEKKP